MNLHPQVICALLVVLKAVVLSLLIIAVLSVAIFIIPESGSGLGIALAIFNVMWAGAAFLVFLPCLLIVAAVLASVQSKNQVA